MYLLLKIISVWLLCLASVTLHELGHALGFRLGGGGSKWRVKAGSGPGVRVCKRFELSLLPVGGFFIPDDPNAPGTRRGALLMLAGGPLVSLLLAALFGALRFGVFGPGKPDSVFTEAGRYVTAFLLCYNFFQFMLTAIPMRYRLINRGFPSDGMQFAAVLKGGEEDE